MYADQISTGRKRSVHERLDADLPSARGGANPALRARQAAFKRSAQAPPPSPPSVSLPLPLSRVEQVSASFRI
jgi:hypothetical protein